MKTPGFEARFSQNLAPVGARKATKPLPCLHFTFIQPALINGNVFANQLWLFGLCYAIEGGCKGWNPYIERHLAIFVNCFLSRAN
jgi:hypothetical protein